MLHWRAVFRALIGSYLRHERGRTLLTVLGVALGVAVLVAINLAIDSALAEFKGTLRDVAGRATLTVRGNGVGLPAALLPVVVNEPGVLAAAPLIQSTAIMPAGDGRTTETLLLLGVDVLGGEEAVERSGEVARQVREFHFRGAPGRTKLSFLTDPSVIVLTERLARRDGLQLGQTVDLIVGGIPRRFVIGALVDAGPLAGTLDGAVAVLDIGIADLLLSRQGLLDRIDLITTENTNLEALQQSLQRRLPDTVLVERPESRSRQVDQMLAAFRFNLDALGCISLLVGAFLIYNTMSVAVVRRAAVIGTLRAMGVSRAAVRSVFLLEGALLGAVGGVLGLAAGVALARSMIQVVAAAISINFVEVQGRGLVSAPGVLLGALALGVGMAVLAALGPAGEAARTAPANTMRRGAIEGRRRSHPRRIALGCLCALGAGGLLLARTRPGLPWIGYGASLLITLAFVAWSRPLLALTVTALRRPWSLLFRAEGLLAIAGTRGALGRATVAISGLLIALAMAISIGVMVASFRDTVVVWMGQILRADLYLAPQALNGTGPAEPMPAAIIAAVERIPGVATVDPFRWRQIDLDGRTAHLGGGRFDVVRYDPALKILDGRQAQAVLGEARAMGGVIVSEAFSRKHGVRRGDRLPIPTPAGVRRLPVAGVYFDYSTEQGYIIMDRGLYLQLFKDPMVDTLSIYLRPGADRDAVAAAVRQAAAETAGMPLISLRANRELREFALKAFNRSFRVTYVMEIIAVVIAVLGVANTLLSQIIDRRDEIVTLRTLGASRGRVARVVVLESSLIGLAGVGLGVAAGLLLSWVLARIIMLQSFGWTIQYRIPWPLVAQVCGVVFVATLAAAVLPAREATRLKVTSGRVVGA